MSIQTQIERISSNIASALSAIRAKGVTVPDGSNSDALAGLIGNIETGSGGDDGSFKAVIERTATDITLPSDLTKIGMYAFYNCANLALTSLPDGITSIGMYAFFNCYGLALTSIPDGITSIGKYSFYNCSKLALTSLPDGITSINIDAFYGCSNLKQITFGGTPNVINSSAFDGCTNLTTINVPWAEGAVANAPWGATNATINYNYTGE